MLKKRIAACLAAVVTAVSAVSISAGAAYDTVTGTLDGYTCKGIITDGNRIIDGIEMPFTQDAVTLYYGTGARIFVALDVLDYYTGETLDSVDRTEFDPVLANQIGLLVGCNVSQSHLTLYSSHEVIKGNDVWGEYQQLIDV